MITQSELKEILHYNHKTGFFTWLKHLKNHKYHPGDNPHIRDNYGYIHIWIMGVRYKSHRLAFLYMDGEMPKFVDHINHIGHDNRWANLRPATSLINQRNHSMQKNNTSGFNGVCWDKNRKKWQSKIKIKGITKNLGRFDLLDDAIKARKSANIKYDFHPNHGIKK